MRLSGCETSSQAASRGKGARAPGRFVAELVIDNSLAEIARTHDPCRQAAEIAGLDAGAVGDLLLVLDELLSNAIRHAFPDGGTHPIAVRFTVHRNWFEAIVEHGGVAFDPADAPPPDRSSPLHERRVGGLGLHFARELVDELRYRRIGETNQLRLRVRIGGRTAGGTDVRA